MAKQRESDDRGPVRPPLPAFAIKLKALRESAGLTQEELAQKAGLHVGAVFKLEQGRREPTWATVQTLCKALGVNCQAFEDEANVVLPEAETKVEGKGRR